MSITVADVILMEQIIKVCQARGAFKAEEMVDIGTLYNKLNSILEEEKKKNPPVVQPESKLPTIPEN